METLTQAIRRAVVATGCSMELATRIAHKRAWRGRERDWQSRLDQMLSDGCPMRLYHVDDLPDAIEVTRDLSILAPAHAAMAAVQARDAEEAERPKRHGPKRAEPRRRKEDVA